MPDLPRHLQTLRSALPAAVALAFFLAAFAGINCTATAEESKPAKGAEAKNAFRDQLAPFLKMHCYRCHGGEKPEAELALDKYRDSANIQQDFAVWEKSLRMIVERQMPPDGEPQPSAEEALAATQAIEAELATFHCGDEKHPGRVTLRRLNRTEYNNTIRDLVGIDFQPAQDFPSDNVGNGFDNIGDVLSIPPILLEKYLAAAGAIVEKAFESQEIRERLLAVKQTETIGRRDALRRNLSAFAFRAFRRPPTDEEMNRLLELARFARDQGASDNEAFQAAMQAILASPHFLFRVEDDPLSDDTDGIRELSDFEVASRLSYFLWSSMPDEELFNLAQKGELKSPEMLKSQVKRMLADAKARSLIKDFAGQWLQLRDVPSMTPDPERFPNFDEPLRSAMLRETELFLETLIAEDRSVLDLLVADFSFLNERLAQHYGIEGVSGAEFRRVTLPDQRRGVLTQGSILLLTSNPGRTSPVKRGKWILENILGTPPPPPPPNVPELQDEAELLGSLRERMEQHRSNPSCAVCHRQMDALGFGLENFDAVGAWRDREGRFEIDASGVLPGDRAFAGPKELMTLLSDAKKNEFCRCLTEKMLTYALGRGLTLHDRCAVKEIIKQLGQNDYRLSSLVTAIVLSDPFLLQESTGEKR